MFFNFGYWGYLSFLVTVVVAAWCVPGVRGGDVGRNVTKFVLIGWCFLPKGVYIDLPLMPPIFKDELICLFLLLGLYIFHRPRFRAARFMRGADLLFVLMVIQEYGAYKTNPDPIAYGPTLLPAIKPIDMAFFIVEDFLIMVVPFLLGRVALRTRRDGVSAAEWFARIGIIYVPFILYELRMAPVLHQQIYGYTWHNDFSQNLRDGGYRPVVFMGHGLVLGMLWVLVMSSAALLLRLGYQRIMRIPIRPLLFALTILMVLIKAKAAMVMGVGLTALILWVKPRTMVRVSAIICVLLFVYPLLHYTDSFPRETIVNALSYFGKERVESMEFRFDQETLLSARARERPWFGWGGYARERIHDDWSGQDLSVQDGHWIIIFGIKGVLGFVAHFGMWVWPLMASWWRFKHLRDERDKLLVGGFALMLAAIVFNMVPNGTTRVIPGFIGGALIAWSRNLPRLERRERQERRKRRQEAEEAVAASATPEERPAAASARSAPG